MIPIIYNSNETQFQNNGLGRLPDCVSCRVTEERNGVFELELVYPITGHNYDLIQIGRIIYTTHDATKTPQPFDIYKRSVPIDGHVTFSAHHISYRLNGMVVTPFTVTGAAGAALAALGSHSITSCPFTFSSDRTTSLTYTVSKPDTIRRLLGGVEGSILDVYGGGDYTFNKFNVAFGTRGADNGVTIRYGKQMTDIDAEHSTEGTYNAVVPFWSNDTTMVTLPEWYVSNGTPEALAGLDLSSEWQEAPTAAQLRAKAQERLTNGKPWEPDENIEVSFIVQPEDYEGIENLQRVVLCDTVTIAYPAAGVSAKIRVIKTEYNPLTESYNSVELGTPQTSLAQTITEKAVSDTLKQTITAGFMNQAIQKATDLIAGGLGGHVVIGRNADGEPEEILIMDTDDVQTAVNVIRMNQAGIGFSTDGYDGPFTSAWTIDGTFNTAFIQVAALSALSANAGTITAGVLRSSDYSYTSGTYTTSGMIIDLDNKIIRTPKTAILSDGSIYSSSVDLTGKITATSGRIGPWTIGSNAIYNTLTSMTDASHDGTYLGTDGIKMVAGNQTVWNALVANSTWSYIESGNEVVGIRMIAWPDGSSGLYEYDVPGGNLSTLWLRSGTTLSTDFHLWVGSDVDSYVNILKSGTIALSAPTGGKIEFCYDGEIPATASIYESARGQLTLTGHATLDLPLTGGTVSGSIAISATGKGFNLTDSSGTTYGGIYDNGNNLWIGATSSTSPHHRGANGNTYISAGYNTSSAAGNSTIYISVPSLSGITWSHTSYGVLHTGNYHNYALPLSGGTLTGNLVIGSTSDTVGRNLTIRNSLGNVALSVGTDGAHGIWSNTKGGFLLYANSSANSTDANLYIPRSVSVTGIVRVSNKLIFSVTSDTGILQGYNGSTVYNILRNHANGNVSLSACSAGLYLGYENSTFVNFLNGKMSLNSQGSLTIVGQLSTGGKGTGTDGKAGTILSSTGNLYLQHTSGSNIYFFYGTSTSSTARLYESASGTLRVSSAFTVDGIFRSPSTWSNTTTNSANVRVIDQYGQFQRYSSSSRRYKHDITAIVDYKKVLDIPVVTFKYNDGYISGKDQRYGLDIPGFIAEEVEKLYPIAAEWVDGKIEDWNARYIIPPMLAVEQDHEKRITALERENEKLKTEIKALKGAA